MTEENQPKQDKAKTQAKPQPSAEASAKAEARRVSIDDALAIGVNAIDIASMKGGYARMTDEQQARVREAQQVLADLVVNVRNQAEAARREQEPGVPTTGKRQTVAGKKSAAKKATKRAANKSRSKAKKGK